VRLRVTAPLLRIPCETAGYWRLTTRRLTCEGDSSRSRRWLSIRLQVAVPAKARFTPHLDHGVGAPA
jgi:hypothetical protein